MGYTHGNIVYNINEVKDRFSIGTIKNKIFLLGTLNTTTNLIVDDLRSSSNLFYLTLLVVIIFIVAFAFETKKDRTLLLVSTASINQLLQVFSVNIRSLTLKIRSMITSDFWAFVPV